jgi:hypothetical protein
LVSSGETITAVIPRWANSLTTSSRASATSWSGKKSRLPMMTPSVGDAVFMVA